MSEEGKSRQADLLRVHGGEQHDNLSLYAHSYIQLGKNIFTQLRPSSPDKTSARLFLFSNPPSLVNTPWAPILTKPTLSLGGTH